MSLPGHLWQTTLCVGLAAVLAFALRARSARTRHAIWLGASLKFLIPLALFVSIGRTLATWQPDWAGSVPPSALDWLDQPFRLLNFELTATADAQFRGNVVTWAVALIWIGGAASLAWMRFLEWREVSSLSRSTQPFDRGRETTELEHVCGRLPNAPRVRLVRSSTTIEPGLIGIWRPTLMWPDGLSDQLTDDELRAVLLHEVTHAIRRDNLNALLQVVVETLFWFHPAAWWIGRQLVKERERACDEEVLRMGTNERSYVEAILKVCRFCMRAPAPLMAGVSGSNLSARIASILESRQPPPAGALRRIVLASIVVAIVTAPMAAGIGAGYREQEQSIYRPGEGITLPRLTHEVKPRYTPEAMQAHIEGSVMLAAVVLESGSVGEVTVEQSLDSVYGLDQAAVNAVKQWGFDPGTKDGKPVAVRVEIEISFKLKS
jgi:bla regulator protein BlaR1